MIKAVNAALKAKAWTFEANFIGPEVKATAMALRTTQWLYHGHAVWWLYRWWCSYCYSAVFCRLCVCVTPILLGARYVCSIVYDERLSIKCVDHVRLNNASYYLRIDKAPFSVLLFSPFPHVSCRSVFDWSVITSVSSLQSAWLVRDWVV